jgi:hypothetical protein
MCPVHYTITSKDIYRPAARVLQPHLRWRDRGPKCTVTTLLQMTTSSRATGGGRGTWPMISDPEPLCWGRSFPTKEERVTPFARVCLPLPPVPCVSGIAHDRSRPAHNSVPRP